MVFEPMKSLMPESSVADRLRLVPFSNLALSVIFTFTVMMSPTCMARWSLKNAREPLRQSEFGLKTAGCGAGIGICTGL